MEKRKKRISSMVLIWGYLIVSIIGTLVVSLIFNTLITKRNNELTIDIGNLDAEKVNRSIEYMLRSVEEMATVLSYQDLLDFDQTYDQLNDSILDADYISIGIIANNGKVYGTAEEQEEMKKWNLLELAKNTETVSTSEPYRSMMTGKLVFTAFSPIYQKGERKGCIFVTYPLSEIQGIANTTVLQDEVEIYLMNAYSNNIILCSGSDVYKLGNWSNTRLMTSQISKETRDAYFEWEDKIRKGIYSGTVTFELDGVQYTQVYEQIRSMKGWCLVCRIPNSTLSYTLQQFRVVTISFVLVLLLLSVLLISYLRGRDREEQERFAYMSTHDALTDVYNRHTFDSMVQKAMDQSGKDERGALIFFDVDYFKQINDRFGHDNGDKALITFSGLLKELFREDSIIARYGGDEFVVYVKKVTSEAEISRRLESLKQQLRVMKIFESMDADFRIHYSAGVAVYPDCGKKFEGVLICADAALYKTKENGRDGYSWYEGLGN